MPERTYTESQILQTTNTFESYWINGQIPAVELYLEPHMSRLLIYHKVSCSAIRWNFLLSKSVMNDLMNLIRKLMNHFCSKICIILYLIEVCILNLNDYKWAVPIINKHMVQQHRNQQTQWTPAAACTTCIVTMLFTSCPSIVYPGAV